MTRFETLKLVHVSCVVLSISLFQLRAWRLIAGFRPPDKSGYRMLPHVIDTVLLLSALGMLVLLRQNPFAQPWLTAKITALVFYIYLGYLALKRRHDRRGRVFFTFAATLCFAYIAAVAISRRPMVFL